MLGGVGEGGDMRSEGEDGVGIEEGLCISLPRTCPSLPTSQCTRFTYDDKYMHHSAPRHVFCISARILYLH